MPWRDADTITVKVTPKAATNHIRVDEQPDGTSLVRVYVTAAPEDGKANKAVIALLAKEIGVPKSCISILRGATGRDKTIHIARY